MQKDFKSTWCGHETPVEGCRLCVLANDPRYRELWGLPALEATSRIPLDTYTKIHPPCIHRTAPTGEECQCAVCGGGKRMKVFGCAIHGKCTTDRKCTDESIVCCMKECKDRVAPKHIRKEPSSAVGNATAGKEHSPSEHLLTVPTHVGEALAKQLNIELPKPHREAIDIRNKIIESMPAPTEAELHEAFEAYEVAKKRYHDIRLAYQLHFDKKFPQERI